MPYRNDNDESKYKVTFWAMLGVLFCLIYMWLTKN